MSKVRVWVTACTLDIIPVFWEHKQDNDIQYKQLLPTSCHISHILQPLNYAALYIVYVFTIWHTF